MAVRKEEIQLDIILSNGKKAGSTLNELQGSAAKLNREIKNLKPGTEEFTKKSADLRAVNQRIRGIKDEMYGANQASKGLLGTFGQFIPFSGQFQRLQQSVGAVQPALGGATQGAKGLRIALISIPLIAIVTAIMSLFKWLTSTQEGMDKLTAVTRPLQVIFQRLLGVIQELGGKLFKQLAAAVKDPIGALKDLGEMIRENIINRINAAAVVFKGFQMIMKGDFKEGLKEITDGTLQFATGVEDMTDKIANGANSIKNFVSESIEQGTQLDLLTKQIEKTEIDLIKNRERLRAEYEKQKEVAQDQSRAEEERIAAARAAQAAQNELLDMEQKFMDLKIERMKLEHTFNDTSRADYKELAQLEAERTAFEAQAARRRASAKNLENTVSKQIAAEEEQRQKERISREEEALKKEAQAARAIEELKVQMMEEGLDKQLAQIDLEYQAKLEKLEGNEAQITEQRMLIEEQRAQAVAEARRAKEEELREEDEELQKEILEEKFLNSLLTEEQYQEALYELRREQMMARLDLIREEHGLESLEYQKQRNEILSLDAERRTQEVDNARRTADLKAEIEKQSLSMSRDFLQLGIEFLSEDEKQRRKHANAIKAFSAAKVTTDYFEEIQAIWKNSNANPGNILFPGLGPILAIAKTVAATARWGLAVRNISSQKFAMGGMLSGPKHAQGGIKMIDGYGNYHGEVEGDEIILTGNVGRSAWGRSMASQLNAMFGGRKFQTGGPINPLSPVNHQVTNISNIQQSPQTAPSAPAIGVAELREEMQGLRVDFQTYASKVDSWARVLEVNQSLGEVEKGLKVRQDLRSESEF